ncbi:hypothetical protein [Pseudoxanthomonas suwonensis]|uniref:hypothetical protein n=1 Tax=Pseudoxanthomonas suwonensis TaxID=314722 RepID=UPI000695C1D5|nr:hypothetical protein [Pseudoxanthomonas suwonensis]
MKPIHRNVFAGLCVLSLAACGTDVAAPGAGDAQPAAPTTDAPPPIDATGGTGASRTTLSVADAPVPHLVDASGASLYVLEGNADGSKCDAACQAVWPPVLVDDQGIATGGAGVDAAGIGTHRQGQQTQLTWRGQPLYRYAGDLGAARTAGDDIDDEWGRWSLARP